MNWYKQSTQNIGIIHADLVAVLSKKNVTSLQDFIYKVITTNFGWQNKISNLTPALKEKYNLVTESAAKSNPAWSQWDVKKDVQKEASNYKLYFTPNDDSIEMVIAGIQYLSQYLAPIANKYQMNLDYKIPTTATGYIGHNDRLVIHFGNKNAAQEINNAISQWAAAYSIQFGNRIHQLGQDVGPESWGSRVANHLAQYAIQYINSGQYTAEQVAQWVEKYLPQVLSQMGAI